MPPSPEFHGSTTDLGVLTRLAECLDNASDMTAAAALAGGWVANGCTNVPDFDR